MMEKQNTCHMKLEERDEGSLILAINIPCSIPATAQLQCQLSASTPLLCETASAFLIAGTVIPTQ
jgi:hypothetical protein